MTEGDAFVETLRGIAGARQEMHDFINASCTGKQSPESIARLHEIGDRKFDRLMLGRLEAEALKPDDNDVVH